MTPFAVVENLDVLEEAEDWANAAASRSNRCETPQDSTHLPNAPLGEVLGDEAVACHYCLSEKMPTAFLDVPLPSHTLQLAAQTPDLFVPVTQMAGAGEGFFPPIPQLLFPPTDDALADSQALIHLDCGTALFRSHHENTSCAKIQSALGSVHFLGKHRLRRTKRTKGRRRGLPGRALSLGHWAINARNIARRPEQRQALLQPRLAL